MIEFYKNIINLRNKLNVLKNGDSKFLDTKNENVFSLIRYNELDDKILIIVNRDKNNQNINISIPENILEEIDINYSIKKYVENIYKEDNIFNINIKGKSFRIFNIKNITENKK